MKRQSRPGVYVAANRFHGGRNTMFPASAPNCECFLSQVGMNFRQRVFRRRQAMWSIGLNRFSLESQSAGCCAVSCNIYRGARCGRVLNYHTSIVLRRPIRASSLCHSLALLVLLWRVRDRQPWSRMLAHARRCDFAARDYQVAGSASAFRPGPCPSTRGCTGIACIGP